MPASPPIIVWFRNDLRLHDNPALNEACAAESAVIALFILDETTPGIRPLGGASRWWLHHSLQSLATALGKLNIPLVLRRGPAAPVLDQLVKETTAGTVFWNRRYDPGGIASDTALKSALTGQDIDVRSFDANLLHRPWGVSTNKGSPYRVFTPFWRALRATKAHLDRPISRPEQQSNANKPVAGDALTDWRLLPDHPDWAGGLKAVWSPGEASARRTLEHFLDTGLRGYGQRRDVPYASATSLLSPHLHFGEISPRTIWAATQHHIAQDETLRQDGEKFLSELGWREFSHYLLFHFPKIEQANFNEKFDGFPWRRDDAGLAKWQRGQTGYPIVDAGMRELWTTGYMHNRVRMIVASFLTKHLRIHWRHGEAWFWDTLVDADSASNVSNWQWVAGTGADAAPYFRIFNPILQGEKFDAEGHYVRRWVPELHTLPDKLLHHPWTASPETLKSARVELGQTYPHPMVEHSQARNAALDAFRQLNGS